MPGKTSPFHCKLLDGGVPTAVVLLVLVLSGCGEKAAATRPRGQWKSGLSPCAASDVVLAAEFSGRTAGCRRRTKPDRDVHAEAACSRPRDAPN